jgi:hypothetical protein
MTRHSCGAQQISVGFAAVGAAMLAASEVAALFITSASARTV